MTVTAAPAARLARVVDRMEHTLAWLLVLLMGAMVVDVTWQVVSRFLLRAPSSFTEELAGFLLIWIGLMGAAYGVRTRAHLAVDLLVVRLRAPVRRLVAIVSYTLVALFAGSVMLIGGIQLAQLALQLDNISAAMGIRVGYVYLALPLAGILIVVFCIEAIVRVAQGGSDA